MAERRGEDLDSLQPNQALARAKEEYLGVDAAMLTIVIDELPIMEQMTKQR